MAQAVDAEDVDQGDVSDSVVDARGQRDNQDAHQPEGKTRAEGCGRWW